MKTYEELNKEELIEINGGYAPPSEEQLEALRRIYGPFADTIICW